MDFGFTDVQEELRGLARQILSEQVTLERLKELEAGSDRVDRRVWEEFAKANLLGISLSDDVGGSGYGVMETCVILEEVGRRVAPIPFFATVATAAAAIDRFGSDEQRQRLLPPVVAGSSFLTIALEEASHHDVLGPTTRARREGGRWLLDGERVAVPWAPIAERVLVTASTGGGRVGVFLVDPNAEGARLEWAEATNREPRGRLVMAATPVPDADVVGEPEAGDEEARWIYDHALAGLCATGVGVLEEAVRITAGYISEREQFGRPLATFQGATLKAADAYIDCQATSVATWSAVWRLADGRPASEALAIAKFWVADGGQRVAHACQHLHGGIGVDIDYPLHRYFLWAKELETTLGGATEQLLRLGAAMTAAG